MNEAHKLCTHSLFKSALKGDYLGINILKSVDLLFKILNNLCLLLTPFTATRQLKDLYLN